MNQIGTLISQPKHNMSGWEIYAGERMWLVFPRKRIQAYSSDSDLLETLYFAIVWFFLSFPPTCHVRIMLHLGIFILGKMNCIKVMNFATLFVAEKLFSLSNIHNCECWEKKTQKKNINENFWKEDLFSHPPKLFLNVCACACLKCLLTVLKCWDRKGYETGLIATKLPPPTAICNCYYSNQVDTGVRHV